MTITSRVSNFLDSFNKTTYLHFYQMSNKPILCPCILIGLGFKEILATNGCHTVFVFDDVFEARFDRSLEEIATEYNACNQPIVELFRDVAGIAHAEGIKRGTDTYLADREKIIADVEASVIDRLRVSQVTEHSIHGTQHFIDVSLNPK